MTDGATPAETTATPPKKKKGMALYTKILIGMAIGMGIVMPSPWPSQSAWPLQLALPGPSASA